MSIGVLYTAFGEAEFARVRVSARTLKAAMPDLAIRLVTDTDGADDLFESIERIGVLEDGSAEVKLARIAAIAAAPFEKTVFLAASTHVVDGFTELFDLLDRFDFAAARARVRLSPAGDLPSGFSELQPSVLAYRKRRKTATLFRKWRTGYGDEAVARTPAVPSFQPSLARAVHDSGIAFYVLPPEYNYRFGFPGFAGDRVKILNGQLEGGSYDTLAAIVNAKSGPRVFQGIRRISAPQSEPAPRYERPKLRSVG